MMVLLELFLAFARIGSFAIGGGYVILPLLLEEAIKSNWMTQSEFIDMLAVSQITPGPIAINMATYVGYHNGGVPGSLVASFAVVLPSFVFLMILVKFFFHFYESPLVRSIFHTLRPTVTGLIAAAGFQIGLISILNVKSVFAQNLFADFNLTAGVILAVMIFAIHKFNLHPIGLVILSGLAGIIFM